jgi:hypothetical protein
VPQQASPHVPHVETAVADELALDIRKHGLEVPHFPFNGMFDTDQFLPDTSAAFLHERRIAQHAEMRVEDAGFGLANLPNHTLPQCF